MATTTNYSWSTPDDTALVKDGAAAIRSLGTAIDTTVFTNAGAAIAKTIVDAKGDIIAATAADTVARLAVGTNGQYLGANSSTATGLEWQTLSTGAYTSLASGTLSTSQVSLTGISAAYTDLILYVNNPYVNTATPLAFRIENNSTGSYSGAGMKASSASTIGYFNETKIMPSNSASLPTNSTTKHSASLMIKNYAQANHKAITTEYSQSGTNSAYLYVHATPDSSPAVTSIQIRTDNGTSTFSGGTYTLYGVK